MQQPDQRAGHGQAGVGTWGVGRQGQGTGCGRAHLGQEGRDEHEEDVVDEQHQQQQCAGLRTDGPGVRRAALHPGTSASSAPPPPLPRVLTHRPSRMRQQPSLRLRLSLWEGTSCYINENVRAWAAEAQGEPRSGLLSFLAALFSLWDF